VALPNLIDPATPPGSQDISLGDDRIRELKQAIIDIFGLPSNTNISVAGFSFVAAGLQIINFQDIAADPTVAGRVQRNAANLKFHDGTASRTLLTDVSGAILASLLTTKGDLIVRDASTPQRFPVGANDLSPVADSAQTLGVKWDGVRTVKESGGPTNLVLGAITDGQFLKRSGTTVVGAVPSPFSTEFISADQTVTFSSVLTVAHGLASKPKLVQVSLKNATAELNYSTGDEVCVSLSADGSTVNGFIWYAWDATNVKVFTTSRALVPDKSTGTRTDITAANWKFVVRAWL